MVYFTSERGDKPVSETPDSWDDKPLSESPDSGDDKPVYGSQNPSGPGAANPGSFLDVGDDHILHEEALREEEYHQCSTVARPPESVAREKARSAGR